MKNILLFSFILITLSSCLKDENAVIIQGMVTDLNTGAPVEGVEIKVFWSKQEFFGTKKKYIESTNTDSNGFYQLKFRPKDTPSYRIEPYRNGFEHSGKYIYADSIKIGLPYIFNFQINI